MSGTTAKTPSVTFGGQVGSIALSLLDTNFTQVATFLNNANNYSNYLVDTGAANSIVVTTPTSVTATYTAGLLLAVKVIAANTGASQINVNSLGLKNILNSDGSALTNNQMPANSIVALVYDGTQFLLAGGSPSSINIAGGTKGQVPVQSAVGTTTFMDSSFAFKNRFINGAMVIDQRNNGASQTLTSGGLYSVDRWQTYATTTNLTGQRVAGSLGFQYAYQITGAASNTQAQFQQKIEAANSYDLAGNTVTLSAYFANTTNTTVNWVAYYANSTDNFSANTTIASGSWTVTSSLARYSTQISIPSAATTGLLITFYNSGQTSGTWTITGVQLEKGSTATSFDYRPYGTELALCQRYYEILGVNNVAARSFFVDIYAAAISIPSLAMLWRFSVTKRAAPTVATIGTFTSANVTGAIGIDGTPSFDSATISANPAAAGRAYFYNNANSGFYASSEL
jgi:hypothetical protein